MLGRSNVIFLAKFQVLSAQETQLLDTMLYVVGQDACVWFGAYTGTTVLPRRDTAYRVETVYSHMNISLHNNHQTLRPERQQLFDMDDVVKWSLQRVGPLMGSTSTRNGKQL